MNSILEFIYVLFFVPCDTFLFISLGFISLLTVGVIVWQSRPIGQIDLEASTSLPTTQRTQQLPRQASQPLYHVQSVNYLDLQPAVSAAEAESENNQHTTCHPPSQSSHTSTSIHNATLLGIHPPLDFRPSSHMDSILETGSLFANDNHSLNTSSPRQHRPSHDSDGSTDSLELSD